MIFDSLHSTYRYSEDRYSKRSQGHRAAAKATYIRLLHGKIGFLGFFSALAP